MNTPVTIITTGRVTADLELKTSQNGRNTKFVQFSLAVNKGYGENNRPKEDSLPEENNARDNQFIPTEDCGENGLPFN